MLLSKFNEVRDMFLDCFNYCINSGMDSIAAKQKAYLLIKKEYPSYYEGFYDIYFKKH
jgi:hypothetical protein